VRGDRLSKHSTGFWFEKEPMYVEVRGDRAEQAHNRFKDLKHT